MREKNSDDTDLSDYFVGFLISSAIRKHTGWQCHCSDRARGHGPVLEMARFLAATWQYHTNDASSAVRRGCVVHCHYVHLEVCLRS